MGIENKKGAKRHSAEGLNKGQKDRRGFGEKEAVPGGGLFDFVG